MANLFVRPSQVAERLREFLVLIQAKQPLFPDLEVKCVADSRIQDEIADSDGADSESITLYVASGLSTGTPITDVGLVPVEITHGVTIGLVIGTRDEQAQYSDELQCLIKEFVIIALQGWIFNEGYPPLFFNNEFLFRVKGRAIYFRTYDFAHKITVDYCDVDNALDLFDDLDDFVQMYSNVRAITSPEGDIAEIDVNIEIP